MPRISITVENLHPLGRTYLHSPYKRLPPGVYRYAQETIFSWNALIVDCIGLSRIMENLLILVYRRTSNPYGAVWGHTAPWRTNLRDIQVLCLIMFLLWLSQECNEWHDSRHFQGSLSTCLNLEPVVKMRCITLNTTLQFKTWIEHSNFNSGLARNFAWSTDIPGT